MITETNINKPLYNYLLRQDNTFNDLKEYTVSVDTTERTVKFTCNKTTTTITIFSIANSMRYCAYTVSKLMGDIITTFGYNSELHLHLDKIINSRILNKL